MYTDISIQNTSYDYEIVLILYFRCIPDSSCEECVKTHIYVLLFPALRETLHAHLNFVLIVFMSNCVFKHQKQIKKSFYGTCTIQTDSSRLDSTL